MCVCVFVLCLEKLTATSRFPENGNYGVLKYVGGEFCVSVVYTFNACKAGEGKAIPLQAWKGPEGSRRLGLPDFKTIGT